MGCGTHSVLSHNEPRLPVNRPSSLERGTPITTGTTRRLTKRPSTLKTDFSHQTLIRPDSLHDMGAGAPNRLQQKYAVRASCAVSYSDSQTEPPCVRFCDSCEPLGELHRGSSHGVNAALKKVVNQNSSEGEGITETKSTLLAGSAMHILSDASVARESSYSKERGGREGSFEEDSFQEQPVHQSEKLPSRVPQEIVGPVTTTTTVAAAEAEQWKTSSTHTKSDLYTSSSSCRSQTAQTSHNLHTIVEVDVIESENTESQEDKSDGSKHHHLAPLKEERDETRDSEVSRRSTARLEDSYYILQTLSCSSLSQVLLVEDKNTGCLYAAKCLAPHSAENTPPQMEVDRNAGESIEVEQSLLSTLSHPNLIKLRIILTTVENVYLLFDYFNGGSLERYMEDRGRFAFSERDVAVLLLEIGGGLAYLHSKGIVHRDLKPDNIFLNYNPFPLCEHSIGVKESREGQLTRIQRCALGDLSLSKRVDALDADNMSSFAGSPSYMAPEIVQACFPVSKLPAVNLGVGKQRKFSVEEQLISREDRGLYSSKCDIWSLGLIMFELFFGEQPVDGATFKDTLTRVLHFDPVIPSVRGGDMHLGVLESSSTLSSACDSEFEPEPCSAQFRNLLQSMLKIDPKSRPTIEEVLRHDFFLHHNLQNFVEQMLELAAE